MTHQNILYLSLVVSGEDMRMKDPDLSLTEEKLWRERIIICINTSEKAGAYPEEITPGSLQELNSTTKERQDHWELLLELKVINHVYCHRQGPRPTPRASMRL